jgi:S-DNA-T family DNA segregation ATPase FtsK/SpoIIIE
VHRCDECGYEYADLPRTEIAGSLRRDAGLYVERLEDLDDDVLRAHPRPDTWSVLEYTCRVRDIFRVQGARVVLALSEWEPSFAPMRRDERAVEERYSDQPVSRVARELTDAAATLAATFDGLSDEGWERRGYNWPTRALRTVEWIGRHTVHEATHHRRDIDALLTATPGAST